MTFETLRALDTGDIALFPVRLEPVGRPVEFYVEDEGIDAAPSYDVRHVAMLGPPGANAFVLESAYLANGGKDRLLRFRYYHIDRSACGDPRRERA